jgi:CheY-like chemotaxis protein
MQFGLRRRLFLGYAVAIVLFTLAGVYALYGLQARTRWVGMMSLATAILVCVPLAAVTSARLQREVARRRSAEVEVRREKAFIEQAVARVEADLPKESSARVCLEESEAATSRAADLCTQMRANEHIAASRGEGTIMVFDDDPTVLTMSKLALERAGFSVRACEDGCKGVGLFASLHDDILCVVLDLTMPGMDGEQALAALRKIHPTIPVVLMSGHDKYEIMRRFEGKRINGFVQKPFGYDQLLGSIRAATAS